MVAGSQLVSGTWTSHCIWIYFDVYWTITARTAAPMTGPTGDFVGFVGSVKRRPFTPVSFHFTAPPSIQLPQCPVAAATEPQPGPAM